MIFPVSKTEYICLLEHCIIASQIFLLAILALIQLSLFLADKPRQVRTEPQAETIFWSNLFERGVIVQNSPECTFEICPNIFDIRDMPSSVPVHIFQVVQENLYIKVKKKKFWNEQSGVPLSNALKCTDY